MTIGEEHEDALASHTTDELSRSPVFVDDSGRRLFRVRAASWFGSTAGIVFLGSIGTAVLIGSVGGPADWNFPFAPQPSVNRTPSESVIQPSSPSTIEALIMLPPRLTAGPGQGSPSGTAPTISAASPISSSVMTTAVAPTFSSVPANSAATPPAKTITSPGASTVKATGKPTVPPAAPKDQSTRKPTPPRGTSAGKATGKPTVLPAAPKDQSTRKPTAPRGTSAAGAGHKPTAPPGLSDDKATGRPSAGPGRTG